MSGQPTGGISIIQIYREVEVCTGYPGPGVSRYNPRVKNPGTKNPGILISEISRDKKSRDFCYLKIPGFFNKIPGYPVGFNLGFFTHFID